MSDLSNLFHFFSSFGGNTMKEKIENMERTYGNNDGTLTESELRNAVEDNEALLEIYGWDGDRDGNFEDLVDTWFKKMDTIQNNGTIKGTGYTETGAISADEIEILSAKAEKAGFIQGANWVDEEFVEGIYDYDMALECKKFYDEYKKYFAENEDMILCLNGWDGAKNIGLDLPKYDLKTFLQSFKTSSDTWIEVMKAMGEDAKWVKVGVQARTEANVKMLKELQQSFSILEDESLLEKLVDAIKDTVSEIWSTIKSLFTGKKSEAKKTEKNMLPTYFKQLNDSDVEGLSELKAFLAMDETALANYDIENITRLKAIFEKVINKCKELEIYNKINPEEMNKVQFADHDTATTSIIDLIKKNLPDIYEAHTEEINAIVSTAVTVEMNKIQENGTGDNITKFTKDIIDRIQKLYSGEMEDVSNFTISTTDLPSFENIDRIAKSNTNVNNNTYLANCISELISQKLPNLYREYGAEIDKIISKHVNNQMSYADSSFYGTTLSKVVADIIADIKEFAATAVDYTAIKSEIEDDYRWEFPTRPEGYNIEYSTKLPKWEVVAGAGNDTRKKLIKDAVINIVKERIPESYEILKGKDGIFDKTFDKLYEKVKFDGFQTAYHRSVATMVNDLLAELKKAVQENVAAHDAANKTVSHAGALQLTPPPAQSEKDRIQTEYNTISLWTVTPSDAITQNDVGEIFGSSDRAATFREKAKKLKELIKKQLPYTFAEFESFIDAQIEQLITDTPLLRSPNDFVVFIQNGTKKIMEDLRAEVAKFLGEQESESQDEETKQPQTVELQGVGDIHYGGLTPSQPNTNKNIGQTVVVDSEDGAEIWQGSVDLGEIENNDNDENETNENGKWLKPKLDEELFNEDYVPDAPDENDKVNKEDHSAPKMKENPNINGRLNPVKFKEEI